MLMKNIDSIQLHLYFRKDAFDSNISYLKNLNIGAEITMVDQLPSLEATVAHDSCVSWAQMSVAM